MIRNFVSGCFVGIAFVGLVGCTGFPLPGGNQNNSGLASQVSQKAVAIAEEVGGPNGFGGTRMNGYYAHAPMGMGFGAAADLAQPGEMMTITLINDSSQEATFHLAHVASYDGLGEQTQEVTVPAGARQSVDIPCSEIVGMGSFMQPGAAGCLLADGTEVANTMSVPIFLGMDFFCGDDRQFALTPDSQDLDGDGDTTELILLGDGMWAHMQNGGPTGHSHRSGSGMMGQHMMSGFMTGGSMMGN